MFKMAKKKKAELEVVKNEKEDKNKKKPTDEEESFVPLETEEKISFEILERHIEKLTQEYQANILKAVRAFYEK